MTNAEVILETARWIEGRLREELPVPAAAARSGYSLHHFIRLFAGVVGVPPKEYILRRKLSEAARELAAGRRRVVDVAFEYGFRDHETFTRAFVRELGATPSAVRRGAPYPYLPAAGEAAGRGESAGGGAPAGGPASPIAGPPTLERFPPALLAGWLTPLGGDPGQVGLLWGRFSRRAPSVPRRRLPERFRQLATWTEDGEDRVDILVALEMETLDELPLDLVGRVLPACECLAFEHRGSAARVGESYRAIYAELLPALDRRPTLPFNFETYVEGAGDPYAEDYRFRICVPLGLSLVVG